MRTNKIDPFAIAFLIVFTAQMGHGAEETTDADWVDISSPIVQKLTDAGLYAKGQRDPALDGCRPDLDQDCPIESSWLRPHLLAAAVHYFHGNQSPDNPVIQQTREALRNA